jgi:hypothetical protein
MDIPSLVVIVFTAVAVLVLVFTLARGGHPENGCGHSNDLPLTTTNEQFYRSVDRPAGPDAEDASLERDSPSPGGKATRRGLRRRVSLAR